MDERFTLLIEKMELLNKHADKVQKEIDNKFDSVQQTQQEIDEKVGEVNASVKSITDDFVSGAETLRKELSESSNETIKEVDTFLTKTEALLNEANSKNKSSIESLVLSVSEKSKEIFAIYDELEMMRSAQTEFKLFLEDSKKQFTTALKILNKEYREEIEKHDFSQINEDVDALFERMEKLEKHSHKHAFGGTKI